MSCKIRYLSGTVAVFFAVLFVMVCALWPRSYFRVDSVDIGDVQHSVVLASKTGKLYVMASSTARWEFHPLTWNVFVRSVPPGQDFPTLIIGLGGERIETILGFGWHRAGVTSLLAVPYWFVVLVSGGLALLWGRRWCRRFSLRTLLVATTLLALVVGLAVASAR